MSAKEPNWPNVQSELLNEVLSVFRRRAKAIKYRVTDWKIAIYEQEEFERLNMDFDAFGTDVRLSIWSDGALWF